VNPRLRTAAAVSLASLAVVACGRQVDVPPPDSASLECDTLVLPDTVAGAGSRPTTRPGTAAWGEPPITWRCGVTRPATLTPTSTLLDVGGVSWLPIEGSGGTGFVATTWPVPAAPIYVEVLVPAEYTAPADVLIDLSAALRTG
jgi:hypothetical protein